MPRDSSEHKLQGFLITTKILILFFYQLKEVKYTERGLLMSFK